MTLCWSRGRDSLAELFTTDWKQDRAVRLLSCDTTSFKSKEMFWVRIFSLLRVRGCLDDWTSNVFSGVILGGCGVDQDIRTCGWERQKKARGCEWVIVHDSVYLCWKESVRGQKYDMRVCTHKCVRKRSQQQWVCVHVECKWAIVNGCEWVRVGSRARLYPCV